ncbi:MAG: hypothetical protein K0R14_1895 [Burkholderiales bacterium]|jgi:hypothetical protein|nr:hypothetical protein [Burkholderiales bacterium]
MTLAQNSSLDNVKPLTGYEVYKTLLLVNPELAKCIKNYITNDEIIAFKASYPFGSKIIKNREVFLPLDNGESISFNDQRLPSLLREHLSYNPGVNNPVGIILSKDSEFYMQHNDRVESYQIVSPGHLIGFAHIMDSVASPKNPKVQKKIYISDLDLDAGARLLFMLANISNSQQHNNLLEAYGINIAKPTDYMQQCNIFRAISNSAPSWAQDIIFFSNKFSNELIIDPTKRELYAQFSHTHRSAYTVWHYAIRTWDSEINRIMSATGANDYSSYAVNIAKHLFLIAIGGAPGFAPVIDDRMCPKSLIEEAYTTKGYGLTRQWPTLMQPEIFNLENNQPVYYSPNLSTLFNFNPETFKGKTVIDLLDKVLTVVNLCQNYVLKNLKSKESYLYDIMKSVKFSFYHSNPDPENFSREIKNSLLLPEEDARFHKHGWVFPNLSHFVRGCIKIEPISNA